MRGHDAAPDYYAALRTESPRRRAALVVAGLIVAMTAIPGGAATPGEDAAAAYCLGVLSGGDPTAAGGAAPISGGARPLAIAVARTRLEGDLAGALQSRDPTPLFRAWRSGQQDIVDAGCREDAGAARACSPAGDRLVGACLRLHRSAGGPMIFVDRAMDRRGPDVASGAATGVQTP